MGGTNWVHCRTGPIPSLCLGEGARRGQVKGGQGVGGDLHIWFRCDVITLISPQRWDRKLGFIVYLFGINNEPCITLPSSLDILTTLGHFNFVLLLFLH